MFQVLLQHCIYWSHLLRLSLIMTVFYMLFYVCLCVYVCMNVCMYLHMYVLVHSLKLFIWKSEVNFMCFPVILYIIFWDNVSNLTWSSPLWIGWPVNLLDLCFSAIALELHTWATMLALKNCIRILHLQMCFC